MRWLVLLLLAQALEAQRHELAFTGGRAAGLARTLPSGELDLQPGSAALDFEFGAVPVPLREIETSMPASTKDLPRCT
ncbi:MAG: hypothetical protein J0L64_00835 [Acidobacteria bacterium]|nr:hypothetical protein [Acidobacteriota bacterium]